MAKKTTDTKKASKKQKVKKTNLKQVYETEVQEVLKQLQAISAKHKHLDLGYVLSVVSNKKQEMFADVINLDRFAVVECCDLIYSATKN